VVKHITAQPGQYIDNNRAVLPVSDKTTIAVACTSIAVSTADDANDSVAVHAEYLVITERRTAANNVL
jgi:hypothetical protein